ncbi:hypothetical protein HH308_15045 [Gordonia sp. TBRC 11910]|uniref:Lipoprotein n=1 Tax=Gordonia asplenii TaxID=2725283 RepID=A0A848L1Y7_9ACTN|nr:hypothetical protein [Gordonia asplenii]NMO02531.1 hypothetical protein [Gordonia asplenii]
MTNKRIGSIVAVVAATTFALAGCSDSVDTSAPTTTQAQATTTAEAKSGTFDINMHVAGMADKSYASGLCKFYDASLQPGDPVVLKGADGSLLGKSTLVLDHVDTTSDLCDLAFSIKGVKAGESAYEITVGDYKPIVVSEQELQHPYYLSPRTSVQAAAGSESQPIKPDKVGS